MTLSEGSNHTSATFQTLQYFLDCLTGPEPKLYSYFRDQELDMSLANFHAEIDRNDTNLEALTLALAFYLI